MKTVNVCFITDNNYTVPTAVAIQSLIEHRAKSTEYNIYIVAVNLDKDKIKTFTKLACCKCRIQVVTTANIYDNINTTHLYVSKAALLKFNLPNIFPKLNKVLYIDGDILVLDDLSDLFDTNINNKYAAAVADILDVMDGHNTKLGLSNYFNSGVMLLNLKKMRDEKIPDKLIDYKINKDEGHFMDQDALNSVFDECIEYLPLKYNMLLAYKKVEHDKLASFYNLSIQELNQTINKPVILHMAGYKSKPWDSDNVPGYELWYSYFDNMNDKIYNKFERFKKFFFQHKVYTNGRHQFLICGIKILSYKPRFAPGAEIKGNFVYTKEKCRNGRVHIYIFGIKIISYVKK